MVSMEIVLKRKTGFSGEISLRRLVFNKENHGGGGKERVGAGTVTEVHYIYV
jgi:hypothetical protein